MSSTLGVQLQREEDEEEVEVEVEVEQPQEQPRLQAAAYVASSNVDEDDECDSTEELMAGEASSSSSARPRPKPCATAEPTVFRLQFLGSVEVEEENGRKRRKRLKKHMVEEAVTRIKVLLPEFYTPKTFLFTDYIQHKNNYRFIGYILESLIFYYFNIFLQLI